MMRPLLERLEARAAAGRPVTVALAGAGRFGTSIAAQIAQIDGLRLAAVADPNTEERRRGPARRRLGRRPMAALRKTRPRCRRPLKPVAPR